MSFESDYTPFFEFVETSTKIINQNTTNAVASMWREKIYNEDFSPEIKMKVPSDGMNQLTDTLYGMSEDAKNILERFKKLSPSDSARVQKLKNATVHWRDVKEIRAIRLYPIENYIKDVEKSLRSLMSKDVSASDLIKKYSDPMQLRNLKSKMVNTSLPYYMTPKDMLTVTKTTDYPVNETTISDVYLDFLLEFYNVRLQSNLKLKSADYYECSFKSITKEIKELFNTGIDNIEMRKQAALETVSDIEKPYILKLFYAIEQTMVQLYQYVVAIYMRTLTAYISNMRALMKVVSIMDTKTGDIECAITESVLDIMDTCTVEKPTDILNAASNLMVAMENIGIIRKDLKPSEEITYDKHSYCFAIQTLSDLNARLKRLMQLCHTELDSSSNELLEECKLTDADLSELFSNTSRASNVNFLKSAGFDPLYVYQDLTMMIHYIPEIQFAINNLKTRMIDTFVRALDTNINNAFPDGFLNKEIMEFLQHLRELVSEYARNLGYEYTNRLVIIGKAINTNDGRNLVAVEPEPYFGEPDSTSYEPIDESCEELEELNAKYHRIWVSKMTGNSFFEDDNQKDNNGNDQNKDNQEKKDEKKDNNSNEEAKKDETKPHVNDPGPQESNKQESNNNEGDKKNSDNKNNSESDKGGKTTSKFKELIDAIVTKITNFFDDGAKEKNKNFFDKNKEYLNGRGYINVQIDVMPYLKNLNVVKHIEQIVSNVSNITDEQLENSDQKSLIARVLEGTGITLPEGDGDFQSKLTQALEIGSKKPVTITIGGGELSNAVPGMISYVENYMNRFATEFKTLENINADLSNLDKSDSNEKASENRDFLKSVVLGSVKAGRDAARQKFNDYLTVLEGLAESNPDNKKSEKESKDENKNEKSNESNDSNNNSNSDEKK